MGRRREKESRFARQLIVEAAIEVFGTKGFHGATMDEIARGAGYSPAALYKYFRNKEEVFCAVMDLVGSRYVELFEESLPEGVPFEVRLRWLLKRHFALSSVSPTFYLAFLTMRFHHSPSEGAKLSQLVSAAGELDRKYMERLEAFLMRGVEEGVIAPLPIREVAAVLIGLINAFRFRGAAQGQSGDYSGQIDSIVSFFLRGVGKDA